MRINRIFAPAVRAFTLVELLVVIVILTVLIAILLPLLSRIRTAASEVTSPHGQYDRQTTPLSVEHAATPVSGSPHARVKKFDVTITLTPRLSVGTVEAESIYEARFAARVQAFLPASLSEQSRTGAGECELELPLPPQIISLSDLSVIVNGQPSDTLQFTGDKLFWRGKLTDTPTPLDVIYTAIGKGIYELSIPPGDILDQFHIALTANGSDVRMLELSLQPTSFVRQANAITYDWNYQRLVSGRPIRLDVLGIAPIDRLGELKWLGPTSVIAFGLVIGLVANAYRVSGFDLWMLLLVLGTFTGAYPLMYFAQGFLSLHMAIGCAAGTALLIIAWRTSTIMGIWLSLFGVTLPAVAIITLTLAAAVQPHLQGIVLTIGAMGLFIFAMVLMPMVHAPQATAGEGTAPATAL